MHTKRERIRAGLLAAFCSCTTVVIVAGCQSSASIEGVQPPPGTHHGTRLRAGAAVTDLTPPPGFPMGGHSIGGTIGRGVWTRLRARTIYVEDEHGCLVLCACDLWSMSGSLADRVAELVAAAPATAHVARERIVLAATHTHHGPAAFTAHSVYAANAARLAGFDPDLHELLARRIASSVTAAVAAAEPATLHYASSTFEPVHRNRSFPAFQLDPEANEVLAENAALPLAEPDHEYPEPLAGRAVDPRIRILAARAVDGRLIGACAFTAFHPTCMRAATEVYHGDVFGVATIEAEAKLARDDRRPVIALFNGPSGDVSPVWRAQDRIETVRAGECVGQRIAAMIENQMEAVAEPRLAGAFAIVPLAAQRWRDERGEHCTARHPVPGAGQLGGAEDGRTFLYDLGWVEGTRGTRLHGTHERGQGVKLPAFEPAVDLAGTAPLLAALLPNLTRLLADPEDFPAAVPIGVYHLGDLWFATLPGEFTTVMGRRIAKSIAHEVGVPHTRVHLVGLANEYVSYFTTPEEYEAQHYEGASTLYGAESGPWIGYNLAQLATRTEPAVRRSEPRSYAYSVAPVRRFGLGDLGEPPLRHDDGLESLIVDDRHRPQRDLPHVEWTAPRRDVRQLLDEPRADAVPFVVVQDRAGKVIADATGTGLLTIALSANDEVVHWTSIWLPPSHAPAGEYTFLERAAGATKVIGRSEWQPGRDERGATEPR